MEHIKKHPKGAAFAAFAGVVGVIALVAGLLFGGDKPEQAAASETEEQASGPDVLIAGRGCDPEEVATQAMLEQGFTLDQLVIGED